MGFGFIINFLKGVWDLFLDFIDFLFDLEEDREELPFPDAPKSATLNDKNKTFVSEDIELLETAFGTDAADYIDSLRKEADYLVQEHGLKRMNSIRTVLPPQQIAEANVAPAAINSMIESIYAQFDGDVILRPGKINVFVNNSGLRFAEMYIDCFKPIELLVKK